MSLKDATDTRQQLLEAAREIFPEKGHRDTTIADICRRAGANIAAVNYHFGSKDELYANVWRHACQKAIELHPLDGGVPADAPVEERFHGHIRSVILRLCDDGRLGQIHRLHIMELTNPTGLIDEVRREMMTLMHQYVADLIGKLLGPHATDMHLMKCAMSDISQCRSLCFAKHHTEEMLGQAVLPEIDAEKFAENVTRFSRAGIRATREAIEQRRSPQTQKSKRQP